MSQVIRERLRRVYYRWLKHRSRYRAPLDTGSIIEHLRATVPDSATVADPPERSVRDRALAEHFRQAPRNPFFVSAPQVPDLVAGLRANRPDWPERTERFLSRSVDQGLAIYERTAAPLDKRFPWGKITAGLGNDELYPYRPQRFAFAPQFALAALYRRDHAKRLWDILNAWRRFATGPGAVVAYSTKLVVTQRFLALSWTWLFVSARSLEEMRPDDWRLESLLVRILFADARFLLRSVGREFHNNHLLADWFICWYIEYLFPEFLLPGERERGHEQGWLAELQRQTFADGTSFEQSVHYHEFVTELLVAYLLLKRRNDQPIPDWVEERAERMLRFQADAHGNQDQAFALGDTTDDPMFPLDIGGSWGVGGYREILRSLFDPGMPAAPDGDPSIERAFWLLGGDLKPSEAASQPAISDLHAYPDGGFFFLRDRDQALTFRTGPAPGTALCAGHMHADLLSVYLRVAGQPILVEAGTGTYKLGMPETDPPWRRYFFGPAAHNGLTIQGEDPLQAITRNFRAEDFAARTPLLRSHHQDDLSWLEARIDSDNGYSGHRRGVVRVSGEYWVIVDHYPDAALTDSAWAGFQLHPDARVEEEGPEAVRVTVGEQVVWVSSSLPERQLLRGSQEPLGGWYSPAYGDIRPAPQLRYAVSDTHAVWLTGGVGRSSKPFLIKEVQASANQLAIRMASGATTDYLLLAANDLADAAIEAWDIRFSGGALLWLRESGGAAQGWRTLGGGRIVCERLGLDTTAGRA